MNLTEPQPQPEETSIPETNDAPGNEQPPDAKKENEGNIHQVVDATKEGSNENILQQSNNAVKGSKASIPQIDTNIPPPPPVEETPQLEPRRQSRNSVEKTPDELKELLNRDRKSKEFAEKVTVDGEEGENEEEEEEHSAEEQEDSLTELEKNSLQVDEGEEEEEEIVPPPPFTCHEATYVPNNILKIKIRGSVEELEPEEDDFYPKVLEKKVYPTTIADSIEVCKI
jgi:hypothetical protein